MKGAPARFVAVKREFPMERGSLIGCYWVERVIEPYENGRALFDVRYEGSYIHGVLCVTDTGFAGRSEDRHTALQQITKRCHVFKQALRQATASRVVVLLPTHVTFHQFGDASTRLVGFYPTAIAEDYLSGKTDSMPLSALAATGSILDQVHRHGVWHGALHPLAVRRSKAKWILPCPIFPIIPAAAVSPSEDPVSYDRKVFAMMVADALSGNTDGQNFVKRLECDAAYLASYPHVKRFAENKAVSFCELFIEQELPKPAMKSTWRLVAVLAIAVGIGLLMAKLLNLI